MVACSTIPLPSGSSNVTKRPQGCSWIPLWIGTPQAVIDATSASKSSVCTTVPFTGPAGMLGNQATRVIEVCPPFGVTCTQRAEGVHSAGVDDRRPRYLAADDWVPEALVRLDLNSLIGLSVAQARALVQEAGGVLQPIYPGRAVGLQYHPVVVAVMIEEELVSSVELRGRVAQDYVPAALAELNLDLLVGLSAARARATVEGAGGELLVLTSWNAPFDVRPWRVTVELVGDQVFKVLGLG